MAVYLIKLHYLPFMIYTVFTIHTFISTLDCTLLFDTNTLEGYRNVILIWHSSEIFYLKTFHVKQKGLKFVTIRNCSLNHYYHCFFKNGEVISHALNFPIKPNWWKFESICEEKKNGVIVNMSIQIMAHLWSNQANKCILIARQYLSQCVCVNSV